MTFAPLLLLLAATPDAGSAAAPKWEKLANGVELTSVLLDSKPVHGDGMMQVVRIDPEKAQLKFALASSSGGMTQTAGEWCEKNKFVAAINAGMYATDHRTNVGRLVDGAYENNPGWKASYKSALAFGPKKKGIPAAVFLDLDTPGAQEKAADYSSVVQNLRLLKHPAENVWSPNGRKWSEAAVAMDKQGHVLFLFSRSPVEMTWFNQRLTELPLDIVQAMHVEGGPEASLSIRAKNKKADYCGSYETSFVENDRNTDQYSIPNVLGVTPRSP
jgi:uncharacterized protein YigE (DUF2233 family)